jgi:hypothetical protein
VVANGGSSPSMNRSRANLYHFAATALVGWYLMMPPIKRPPDIGVRTDVPLSQWRAFYLYENLAACERGRAGRIGLASSTMYTSSIPRSSREIGARSAVEQAKQSACIRSDDARLDSVRAKQEADETADQLSCKGDPNCAPPRPLPPYVRSYPASHPTPGAIVTPPAN